MTADAILGDYLSAISAGDPRRALAVIDGARRAEVGVRTIYLSVLQPALYEVGRRWEQGIMSVAQEHFATAVTQTVMSRLAGEAFLTAPLGERSLIAACVDAERHEVGLRMLCDLLEVEGWTTIYLGPTVPTADLVRMVRDRRPQALALSVSLPPHLLAVRAAIADVRALGAPQPVVMVGGRALQSDPALAARLGADFTAQDAAEAVDRLRQAVP
jgi:methanogenic corrinoid protein MtbC1